MVTMQCDNSVDSCLVFMVESPLSGHCENFLEAVIMANNAHQPGCKVQALGSFSGETMSKLAEVWCDWSGADESGSVLSAR